MNNGPTKQVFDIHVKNKIQQKMIEIWYFESMIQFGHSKIHIYLLVSVVILFESTFDFLIWHQHGKICHSWNINI